MNDPAKLALSAGAGLVVGKLTSGSSSFWWLLAATGTYFVLNSPGTRKAISSGTKRLVRR